MWWGFLVSFFSPELKGPNFVKVKCNSSVVLNFSYCHFFFVSFYFFSHRIWVCVAFPLGEHVEQRNKMNDVPQLGRVAEVKGLEETCHNA